MDLGCKPSWVAYLHRIVPNNDPVHFLFFQLVQPAPEKLRLQRPMVWTWAQACQIIQESGQNKGFGLQPSMVADQIHTFIHTHHKLRSETSMFLYPFFWSFKCCSARQAQATPIAGGYGRTAKKPSKCSKNRLQCVRTSLEESFNWVVGVCLASFFLVAYIQYIPVTDREVLGCSRSRSSWFLIQPVTCWYLPVFLHSFDVYSIDSSKMFGNSPRSLQLQPVHLQLSIGSSRAVIHTSTNSAQRSQKFSAGRPRLDTHQCWSRI